MGWSGGTFTRVHDWTTDEGSAIDIEASRMDAEDDNFESGINACIHKGGTNTPTANLPMGGYRHTGVDDAAALTDYASAADVIDQHLVYYADTGSANAYAITPSPAITAYAAGQKFAFKAGNDNTGASTLDVNSLGTKSIVDVTGTAVGANDIRQDGIYEVVYDGTSFQLMSPKGYETGDVIKVATATDTRSSTVTVTDHAQGLTGWSLQADTFYLIEGYLSCNIPTPSQGGIALYWQFSNAPQAAGGWKIQADTSAGNEFSDATAGAFDAELEILPDLQYFGVTITGGFKSNASTGGTLDMQWAQHTSSGSATSIYLGSWIRVRPLS
jgi:hypothetical protein